MSKSKSKKNNFLPTLFFIALLLFSLAFLIFYSLQPTGKAATTSITMDNCDGETLFRLSAETGHAALYNESSYPYKVCAPSAWQGSRDCDGSNAIVSLSREKNAHVERYDISSPTYEGIDVCFEDVQCNYAADCGDDLCIAALSRDKRAHAGPCDDPDYPVRVCCSVGSCPEGKTRFYLDHDGDGYGRTSDSLCQYQPTDAYNVQVGGDCKDSFLNDPSDCPDSKEDCNSSTSTCAVCVHPNADEACDGIDNDCDGSTDHEPDYNCTVYYADQDDDDFGQETSYDCLCEPDYISNFRYSALPRYDSDIRFDCNDQNSQINPAMPENCTDGSIDIPAKDEDCDGKYNRNDDECKLCSPGDEKLCQKQEGVCAQSKKYCIGESFPRCNSTTYLNHNASYEPEEISCDGLDNDCDGLTDEELKDTYYLDLDNDTYGNASYAIQACSKPDNYVENPDDCNDNDDSINPLALELCDQIDNDCNPETDDGSDDDAPLNDDQAGICRDSTNICDSGNWIESYDYLSDYQQTENDCTDGLDNDCDNFTDIDDIDCKCQPGETSLCPQPGVCSQGTRICTQDHVWGPCNYTGLEYETEETMCDGLDNDCDNETDEDIKITYYLDKDGDGIGNSSNYSKMCQPQGNFNTTRKGDCDDSDPLSSTCITYYADTDMDDYGVESDSKCSCGLPFNYPTTNAGDCDDHNESVNPGMNETCHNDIDDDCDGSVDEDCPCLEGTNKTCGINIGECSQGFQFCENGTWGNCTGTMPTPEICDNKDNNCNGKIDEIFDSDEDGYTNCSEPVADCDDYDKTIYPGALEVCGDTIDQNCDGKDRPCKPKDPTCSDGIKNQGEEEVDCGGPCPACESTTSQSGLGRMGSDDSGDSTTTSSQDTAPITGTMDKDNSWLWFIIIPLFLVLMGLGGYLIYENMGSSKSGKDGEKPSIKSTPGMMMARPTLPGDKQLARDIWARMYKGEQLDQIKREYAKKGYPPELVRRALVDFYMAKNTAAQKNNPAKKQKNVQVKPKQESQSKLKKKSSKKYDQKEDVFKRLKKTIEENKKD